MASKDSQAALFGVLPLPTLDRPFGVHLWPHFNKAFEAVVGYPADDFRFKAGQTPMSTLKETGIFIVIYYIIIFGGRELMRKREPFQLKTLFLIHNLYLTIISGTLLALFLEQLIPTVVRGGIFHAICDADGGWTQPLVVLYYVRHTFGLDNGFVLICVTVELPYQVPRTTRYRVPVPQEEAPEYVCLEG